MPREVEPKAKSTRERGPRHTLQSIGEEWLSERTHTMSYTSAGRISVFVVVLSAEAVEGKTFK